MEDSPHLRRPHVTPRLTERRRDLDAAAKTFLEQQRLLVKSPVLNPDIAIKALGGQLGGNGNGAEPQKRTPGNGTPDENPLPRFAPGGTRKPGQALKLHTTAADLKKSGDEPNFGWVDIPPEPTPEERAASRAELTQYFRNRPKIRVRKFDINPRTQERIEGSAESVEVKNPGWGDFETKALESPETKNLGPSLIESTPGGDIGGRAASAAGLIVDSLGKLRCPPGSPNANQFTDSTGANCFPPLAGLRSMIENVADVLRALAAAEGWADWAEVPPEDQRRLQGIARARGSIRGTPLDIGAAETRMDDAISDLYRTLGIEADLQAELDANPDLDIRDIAFTNADIYAALAKKAEEMGIEMDILSDLFHEKYEWDESLGTLGNLKAQQAMLRDSLKEFMGDAYTPGDPKSEQLLHELEMRYHDSLGGYMEGILHEMSEDPTMFSALQKIGLYNNRTTGDLDTQGFTHPNSPWDNHTGQMVTAEVNIMALVARPYAQTAHLTEEGKLTLVDMEPMAVLPEGGTVPESLVMNEIHQFLTGQAEITPFLRQYIDYYGQDMAQAMGGSVRSKGRQIGYHEVGGHVRQYSLSNELILKAYNDSGPEGSRSIMIGGKLLTKDPSEWTNQEWKDAVYHVMFDARAIPKDVDFPPDIHAAEGTMLHLAAGRYYQDDVKNFLQAFQGVIDPATGLPFEHPEYLPDADKHAGLLVIEMMAELHANRRMGLIGGEDIDKILEPMDKRVGATRPPRAPRFGPDVDIDGPDPDPDPPDIGPPDLDPDLDPATVGAWDRLGPLVSYMHQQGRGPRAMPLELRSRINEEFGYADMSPTWLHPDEMTERLGVFTEEFERLSAKFDGTDGLTKDEQARLFMAARGVEMILNANARRIQDSDEQRAINLAKLKPVEPMKVVPSNLPKYKMDELMASDEVYDIYDVTEIRDTLENIYPKLGGSDAVKRRDASPLFGYHATVTEADIKTSASAHRATVDASLSPQQDDALHSGLAQRAMEHVNIVSLDENITRAAAARRHGSDRAMETGRVDVGQPTPWVDQDIVQNLVPALEAMDDNPLTDRVTVRMGMELDPDSITVGQEITHAGFMQGSIVSEEGESMASMLPTSGTATVRIEVPAGHRGVHVDDHDGSDRGLLLPPGKLVVDGIDDDGTIILSLGEQQTTEEVLTDIEGAVSSLPVTADGDVRRERARVLLAIEGSKQKANEKRMNEEIRVIDLGPPAIEEMSHEELVAEFEELKARYGVEIARPGRNEPSLTPEEEIRMDELRDAVEASTPAGLSSSTSRRRFNPKGRWEERDGGTFFKPYNRETRKELKEIEREVDRLQSRGSGILRGMDTEREQLGEVSAETQARWDEISDAIGELRERRNKIGEVKRMSKPDEDLRSSTQQPRVIDSMREYEAVKAEGVALAQQAYEDAIAAGASVEDAEAAKAAALKLALGFDEKNPIQTNNPEIAMQILLDGGDMHENTWMYVQLQSKRQYRTMMKKFKEQTQILLDNEKAQKKWIREGKEGIPPVDRLSKLEKGDIFDLCKVTVPGTSLFCTKHTNRLRDRMPQLGGKEPAEGSKAWKMLHGDDELPEGSVGRLGLKGVAYQKAINAGKTEKQAQAAADKVQEVNVTELWVDHLRSLGVHIEGSKDDPRFWKASELTATQSNLKGGKTLGMMISGRTDQEARRKLAAGEITQEQFDEMLADPEIAVGWSPANGAILVTRDGYIIDGHHRWAAVVGMDITDPDHPEFDENMPVIVLDMDIEDAMASAVAFADEMGMHRRDMEDVKQPRLSDEEYVEALKKADDHIKDNIDPTPEDQRHILSANSVDDYAAKDQAVRSAATEGLRSSTTGAIGEVPYEDLAEQRGAIIHRWRTGTRLPDDAENLNEIAEEMERRADGLGLTSGLRSSTGKRGQGSRQRESRISKLEQELTGHDRRVTDKMRSIDDARVRGDDAEADRLIGEFDGIMKEEAPLRTELNTLVAQRPQEGLASRRNANGELMSPEEIAASDNLSPIESSTGPNGPKLRPPARDYTDRYKLVPKGGRTTGSVQRPVEANRDGHWVESADGILFKPYDRDTKREMEALQSRLNWLRRYEGDRDNIDTELSEIRQRITDIASTKLLKEKPAPVTRKPMPDLTPEGGLASTTRGSGRARVAEQRRATATPIQASRMNPRERRKREQELQKEVNKYESRLQGKMRAIETAQKRGNEAEIRSLEAEFDRIAAEERPLRQELGRLKKGGLRTSNRSHDNATATRMEKKNKKLADRAKRNGVTPFEQTDDHIAAVRGRAEIDGRVARLLEPGGVPPFGWRVATREEHITGARAAVTKGTTSLRDAADSDGVISGTSIQLSTEVMDFMSSHTDAEVAAAIEKAVQEYSTGFDRKVRVALESHELADMIESGRYKTTWEATSEHSRPDTRGLVEMQWGYGPDTPVEDRPASGFLNHRTHDEIRQRYIDEVPSQIPFQNRDHALLSDSHTIRPSGIATDIYGEVEVVLKTDVSHRSAMLHGDSARGSRRPVKMNSSDPGEILAAAVDHDGDDNQTARMAEFLHASLTGDWEAAGPSTNIRAFATGNGTSVADEARNMNNSYVEAVVHGSFDLEDVDHVRIPLHTLNEHANNINLTKTDLGLDSPDVLDALRRQGLDDGDIERLTAELLKPPEPGSRHPADPNGLFWSSRLRQVMAAQSKHQEMANRGVKAVFPNDDAVDILKGETYLSLPIAGLEPGNAIEVIQQLIKAQVMKRGANIAKKLRPTQSRLKPAKEFSVV